MTFSHFMIVAGALVTVLSACATKEEQKPRLCPQVAILRSLDRVEDHGHDAVEEGRLVGAAVIQKTEGSCTYSDKGADVHFKLSMMAEKGPALGGDHLGFPFFVSLVGPEDRVLGKELMTANFTFTDSLRTATYSEDLHVFIPLKGTESAENHRVLVGFQLTESQAKANQVTTGASQK